MRILITGGHGQLASDLVRSFSGHEVTALGRQELDVTVPAQVVAAFDQVDPQTVINTAAFHKVDLCETEPEASFAVNAAAPQRLAAACRDRGATLVHLSTDYVFDGNKHEPYSEEDAISPLSVYGASKAAGEMAVRCTTPEHVIVRTTGLYGHAGETTRHGNFVETMLRLAAVSRPITVVSDQILTPTYTRDVADTILRLVERGTTGTFHVTNRGSCSWFDFAAAIFRLAGLAPELYAVKQQDRPTPARRPAYSVLGHEALRRVGIEEPRPWQDALSAYMRGKAGEAGTA